MKTNTKIRIGVLGLTHDHVWDNLRQLSDSPWGELVGAADPESALRSKIRSEVDSLPVFESAQAMLDEVALDGVFVYSDNAQAVELVELASDYGLPAMVEKPMAADLNGADRMLAAARKAGVLLMINWPFAWRPGLRKALEMAKGGEIGDIFSIKYRAAHEGPKEYGCSPYFYNWLYDAKKNGAGALLDYCSYGAVLGSYLLGLPSRVSGMAGRLLKEYIMVDDNAVILMQWPNAIGMAEASWTQVGVLSSYETLIYGSEGTLWVPRGNHDQFVLATREHPEGETITVPPLPEAEQNASAYFLSRLRQDQPIDGLCDPSVSRQAQEILEAGLISSQCGEAISLPLSFS